MRKIFTIIKTNMSGGIEQLVARGAQDVFLTGDPQVSFFRSNYKRYTNFSQVRHRQIIQGNPADGGMSTVRFERKGDLLSYTYLVRKETGSTISINNYIDKVELYIGGQLIDTQTEDFFKDIYPETLAKNRSDSLIPKNVNTFAAPRFFFCNNYTNALPLVALQYHDVEMRIYWASGAGIDGDDTFECWSNYIYLDTDEREHFASKPQNMLIRQVQSVEASNESTQELNFNHPVSFITVNDPSPVDSSASVTNTKLLLKINGSDVGDAMEISPHFNAVPTAFHTVAASKTGANINFFLPFSLNVSEEQPSGALNFSRLDSARLLTTGGVFDKKMYAVNFNVLKIENGMGGLLFAN